MNIYRRIIFVILATLFLVNEAQATVQFSKARIQLGSSKLEIEVAKSPEQLAQGLMYRQKLGPNNGMLFIYESEQTLHFWMKNTFIPLSIGFFDKNRKLIDIQDMEPMKSEMQVDIPTYQSAKPAQYALEVQKDWFKKNKVKLGSRFDFLEKN